MWFIHSPGNFAGTWFGLFREVGKMANAFAAARMRVMAFQRSSGRQVAAADIREARLDAGMSIEDLDQVLQSARAAVATSGGTGRAAATA
jgi:hypothetical protein